MKKIFERPIQMSSINRERSGISGPDDFVIRFTPPLQLPEDMYHEIALNKVNMTYSWYNITNEYKNNTIKYSPDSGSTWKKIIFADGNYGYDDLNNFIKETLDNNADGHPDKEKSNIEITFIRSQLKVLIGLSAGFQLDFRGSKFAELIGFEKKLVDKEEIGLKLPNITNSIDVINLNSDVITDSLVDGIYQVILLQLFQQKIWEAPFHLHNILQLIGCSILFHQIIYKVWVFTWEMFWIDQ